MILAVGQHGSWDVDHIVIEIVDGFIWFDFAPGGNGGPLDNANINMNSPTRVNDNRWHTFLGERYPCFVENPTYDQGSFQTLWDAGGRRGCRGVRRGRQCPRREGRGAGQVNRCSIDAHCPRAMLLALYHWRRVRAGAVLRSLAAFGCKELNGAGEGLSRRRTVAPRQSSAPAPAARGGGRAPAAGLPY